MPSSRENLVWIDFARVIAILAVIALHLSSQLVSSLGIVGSRTWWCANIIDSSARWAVPVFIMLSGYTLLNQSDEGPLTAFLGKRFLRVGIPLLAWSAIYYWWGAWFYGQAVTPSYIMETFLAGAPYYHLYFLFVILGLYLITPVLRVFLAYASKAYTDYLLLLSFALSSTMIALNYWVPSASVRVNSLSMFIIYVGYFVAGHWLREVRVTRKKMVTLVALFAALVTLTSLTTDLAVRSFAPSLQWQYFYSYLSPNVIAMSFVVLVMLLNCQTRLCQIPSAVRFFGWLAPATFGIYLVHPIILEVLTTGPAGNFLNQLFPQLWLAFPAKLLTTFLISGLLTMLGSKIPVLRIIWGLPPFSLPRPDETAHPHETSGITN